MRTRELVARGKSKEQAVTLVGATSEVYALQCSGPRPPAEVSKASAAISSCLIEPAVV